MASTLSLRDKIGQMLIIGFEGKQIDNNSFIAKAIEESNIGGVILFDYNYQTQTFDKNIESPQQVKELNTKLQLLTHQANKVFNRPALPLLISVDYEGGEVNRLKKQYGFPETIAPAQASKLSDEEIAHFAEKMAITLKENGFNLNFVPLLDVDVNSDNPIIGKLGRSFSTDPEKVAHYAAIYTTQHLKQGILFSYKHFPGHGSSTTDSHLGFVDVTDTWQNYELQPYQQLLKPDVSYEMIMTAHIVNRNLDDSGLPATLSYKILTEILRQELKFNGVIITDDMQMKAISDFYGIESLTLAINAGADMFIFGNQLSLVPQDPKEIIDIIEAKVKVNEIKLERIEEAYQRVTAFKQNL